MLSSTAVANSAESATRSFRIVDVVAPRSRRRPNSSRTSAGSTALSVHVRQRGSACCSIGRRYSGLVVSLNPRAVRPA
jgi:hypothetical protein